MSELKENSKPAFGQREIIVLVCLVGFISLASAMFNYGNGLSHRTSPTNACINNLRIIDAAKQQWAIDHGKTAVDTPTWDDLKSYSGRYEEFAKLKCPLGGIYTIGKVGESPTCSIATNTESAHILSN